MNKPSVSVIIPTYNRVNLLREAIESVLNQNYGNIKEIVITDDNSTDGTEELVREYMKNNKKVKYVKNIKHKKGVLGNKNNGLDYATGDFIFMLDDDDYLFPDAIETLIEAYLEHSECGIIIANRERSDNKKFAGIGLIDNCKVKYEDVLCGKLKGNFIGIIKRDIIGTSRFNEDIYGCGESVMWIKLHKKTDAYYVHKKIAVYRVGHPSVMSQRDNIPDEAINIYRTLISEFKDEYLRYCPKRLAFLYANLGYFFIISGNRIEAKKNLLISLKTNFNMRALLLFVLLFMPIKIVINMKKIFFRILRRI